MKNSLFPFLLVLFIIVTSMSTSLNAQNTFDIRFSLSDVDCNASTVCYDVQLKSGTASSYGLAGQNYRIYYDNSKADYLSGTKTLGVDYGPFSLVQDLGPVDASNNSMVLGFESTLAFLNYSIDLSNVNTGGITLTSDWMTTSNLCFDVEQSVIDNPNECLELIWARDGLTNSLATAFVEISEWTGMNMTEAVIPNDHDDLTSEDGDNACLSALCSSTEPDFDIRFVRQSVDCNSPTACYDVQLRSSSGVAKNLAGQNYRIYYDNALADFVSGTKLLGGMYDPFTIASNGDVGPSNVSQFGNSLGFESSLGFLNYGIDLNDLQGGGIVIDGNWTSTSNLCFELSQTLIDDDSQCLELIWARDGLTNYIATAFVEIAVWEGVNNLEDALVDGYEDLDQSNGSGSCFDDDCNTIIVAIENDVTINESDEMASIEVCLDELNNEDVPMQYSTIEGSATGGNDYTPAMDVPFIIPAGILCQNINISIVNDSNVEATEFLMVSIIPQSDGLFPPMESQITILDDDILCEAEAPTVGPK